MTIKAKSDIEYAFPMSVFAQLLNFIHKTVKGRIEATKLGHNIRRLVERRTLLPCRILFCVCVCVLVFSVYCTKFMQTLSVPVPGVYRASSTRTHLHNALLGWRRKTYICR